MDPSLFRIDWAVLTEVLVAIVVLAFFVERALSLLFEHRLFVTRLSKKGLKEPIAFLVAFGIVQYWNFDALGVILHADATTWWGYALTAAIVAGGSKASIKLFHGLMNVKSSAAQAESSKSTDAKAKK